jgi:ribosomal protein S18 acetylase RimI-like enzyme
MDDRDCWTIRAGIGADLAALVALWRTAGGRASATDTKAALGILLDRDADSLLVAEVDGEIVGTLIAAWDGWRGSFYRLAIDRRWRRLGVATALVRAGEDRLRGLGAIRVTAIVVDDQGAGVALWEALGYSRQADTSRFIRMVGTAEGWD